MKAFAICLVLVAALALGAEAKKKKNKSPEPPQWKGRERALGSGPVGRTLNVGQSLELDCSARGRPKPRITWFRNGAELAPSDVIKTRRHTLSIKKVQPSDSGNYTCKVKNKEGEIDRTYVVSVKVVKKALRVEGPQNITALEGETVSFRCRVLNDPDATIKWMVSHSTADGGTDSSPPSNAKMLNLNQPDPEVLVLRNISLQQAGKYTCITRNDWHYDTKKAYLTVNPIGVPPSVSVPRGRPATTTTTQPTLPPFMPGFNDPSLGYDYMGAGGLDSNRRQDNSNNNRNQGRKDRKRNRNRKKNRRPVTEVQPDPTTAPRSQDIDPWQNSYTSYPINPTQHPPSFPEPEEPVLVARGNQTGSKMEKPAEGSIGIFTIYTIVGSVAGVILLLGLIAISVAVCCRRDPNNVYKSTSV